MKVSSLGRIELRNQVRGGHVDVNGVNTIVADARAKNEPAMLGHFWVRQVALSFWTNLSASTCAWRFVANE